MIRSGQVTVTTAGTAVQAGTDEAIRKYVFAADPGNTGSIAIGNDGDDDVTMANGLVIGKDTGPFELTCALSQLYVDADNNNDVLTWLLILP